ncbi:unnamed protein product [Prunus armeniaca]
MGTCRPSAGPLKRRPQSPFRSYQIGSLISFHHLKLFQYCSCLRLQGVRCYYKNKRTTSIMEPKRKLLATTSSQAQGACPDHMKDRFSDLPNEVAHQILSSVSILDLTRFGTLSKKCRELYLSTPSLNFDEFNNWNKSSYAKQFKLLSSLDRFLVRRRENKIQCFCICWSLSYRKAARLYNELYRVVTWIHMEKKGRNEAPSLVSSTNLQYLKLTNVTVDEGLCKWISCSCKCIKELHLEHVEVENITMESSSLESFSFVFPSYCSLCHLNISCEKLEDIQIEWRFASTSSRSFKVFALNLEYLKWIGNLLNNQNLGKLMCLEKAEIFLKHGVDNNDFSNVLEVLCSVCRAKVLILSGETTKIMYFLESFEGYCRERIFAMILQRGNSSFDDISYLGMHIESLDDDIVPAMVSLLRGIPNLKTLYIKSDTSLLIHKPEVCGFNKEFCKSQNLAFIDQLKVATIELWEQ